LIAYLEEDQTLNSRDIDFLIAEANKKACIFSYDKQGRRRPVP
jgi:hypothetical protein